MAEESSFDAGDPGASGRREHERRRGRREDKTREEHPHIGGLLLRVQEAPQHERAWASGAAGERELAASLARRCPGAIVLHDRRLPGTRANIDHLAVAPSGVYVIDAKRYKGKVEIRKPFFGQPKLVIRGRDQTKLIHGLDRQVEAVRAALASNAAPVEVHGCLCFVGGRADKPLLRKLSFDGYRLLYPRQLAKWLNRPGELDSDEMRRLAENLAITLPAA
jgi:Nuclease-related domain